jgi:lipid A 3-O-deacylase
MLKRICLFATFISLAWQTCRGDGFSLTPIEIQNPNPPSAGSDFNLSRPPTAEQIWKSGVGEGFARDTKELDVSAVLAFGLCPLGIGANNHNLVFAAVHYGWIFGDVVGEDRWYRGNWELLLEGFAGAQFHPKWKYAAGLCPIIRYNFATGTRWIPFINGGAGPSVTDIGSPDLSTTFEFNLQLGAGLHYFLCDNGAITFEARYLHFSDAGLGSPNEGVNTMSYLLGFSWFF